MTVHRSGAVLALSIGAGLGGCQDQSGRLDAPATLGVERITDSAGHYQTVTRGMRYLLLTPGTNADSATFAVLEERTETRCCTVSEHPTATTVTLTRVDRAPDGSESRPWTWTGSFDDGGLWDKFYRGTSWGCCDALNLVMLISTETGRLTLSYAQEAELGGDEPVWFELPDQGIARYFGLIEPYQFSDADTSLRRAAFAIIQISDGRNAPRRWALYQPTDLGSCCRFGSLRLVASDSAQPGRKYMNRWDRTPGRPQRVTGFDLLVQYLGYDGPDVTLRIPVVDDEFRAESIRGGPGWRLERLP